MNKYLFIIPTVFACDIKIGFNKGELELDSVLVSEDNCLKRCTNGLGVRKVLKYGTQLENIGSTDCEIGVLPKCTGREKAGDKSGPFSYDKCRDGWTLEDFYEISVVNEQGKVIASQNNPGVCVMDAFCNANSLPDKYFSCTTQGIHKGCSDATERTMPCQWIDVTDIIDEYGNKPVTLKLGADTKGNALPKDSNRSNNAATLTNIKMNDYSQEISTGVNFFPLSVCSSINIEEARSAIELNEDEL